MGWKEVAAGVMAAHAIATSTPDPTATPAQNAADDYSSHQENQQQQREAEMQDSIAAGNAEQNIPAEHRPK